jgi:hypothetical protein
MEKNAENKKLFLDIDGIGLSQECVEFLRERLKSSDYRGWHYSQHNRYTFDDVVEIFKILHGFTKESDSNCLTIRTTDISKRPKSYPHEQIYSKFCREIREKIGKGSEDAMRKNFFVDFHRMNLLKRHDELGKEIEVGVKPRKVSKVSISKLGKELINASSRFEKYLVYSKAVDFLLQRIMEPLVILMRDHENKLETEEFQFFVSFLGKELDGQIYNSQKISKFLKEYRNLRDAQKNHLITEMKNYCNPQKFSGNKKDKRDFHNWRNGVQQFFSLLDTAAYFELDNKKKKLFLGKTQTSDEDLKQITKIVRSNTQKQKYFSEHQISKKLDFDLHHIRPLFWVKNSAELKLTDDWRNMIYIRADEHAKITRSWYKVNRIRLSLQENNDNLFLSDFKVNKDSIIEFRNKENLHYNPNKRKLLLDYNKEMLKI